MLESGTLKCLAQDGDAATYAAKLKNAETRIDWSLPARTVHNHIRGLSPYPGAWFEIVLNGKRERVRALGSVRAEGDAGPGTLLDESLTIACGEGAVRLMKVQRAGKKPVLADAFLNGTSLKSGLLLD